MPSGSRMISLAAAMATIASASPLMVKRTFKPLGFEPQCTPFIAGQKDTGTQVCLSFDDTENPQAVIVTYPEVPGMTYDAGGTHLYMGMTPPTKASPGRYNYNDYCVTNGDAGAVCTVPFTDLPGGADVCRGDLYYLATHAALSYTGGVSGGETAYGKGPCIDALCRPWAMYWSFHIECGEPEQPPQPPAYKMCPVGTAFGKMDPHDTTLISYGAASNRWGWVNVFEDSDFTTSNPIVGELYAGAGKNDITKATDTGGVYCHKKADGFEIGYTVTGSPRAFDLAEIHIYISCHPPTTYAPGQYGHTVTFAGEEDRAYSHFFSSTYGDLADCWGTGPYYLIQHASVEEKVSGVTECPSDVE